MAGDHTVNGLLNQRDDVARDDLPFGIKPSSGIYGDRTVMTYGTLDNLEAGRTIEPGTQEGAGDLPPGEIQETTVSRSAVGTRPEWNEGVGRTELPHSSAQVTGNAPVSGSSGTGGGSGPGTTHMARPDAADGDVDTETDGGAEGSESKTAKSSSARSGGAKAKG